MFEISELARDKIKERLREVNRPELALRAEIVGRSEDDFHYRLSFVPEELDRPDDEAITTDGLTVLVDPVSSRYLDGARLDYVDESDESGFKFDNPNPLWHDEHAREVNEIIASQINPSIAIHGGHVTLLDVQDEVAYVNMGGGCQGCGLASVTLRQGVEKMIMEAVPSIKRLVDTTDHTLGVNPYFQRQTSGESPLA
ncbi:MAG: NifU family protein, partial [Anaerolineales bacterium]